ncbi:MAG TPA: oxygen-insensitive NADPH nitroreductase [Clostridiaceae bacterium]|nr:oxygen-insensitive NADPH nitroreductase [Clostridiaceae bacterium]
MNETIRLMKKHTSVRHFKDYPISTETLTELIVAGQSAASSNFVQAYTVINVIDEEKRKIIAEIAGNQSAVLDARLFLVFVADLERARLSSSLHDEKMIEGQTESFIITTVDTALMAQNVMLAAESMGLGGVYIGAIRNNPDVVSELLELPEHTYPLFGMCLGYPLSENERKPRLPVEIILKTDTYQSGNEVELLREYDSVMEEYYLKRTTAARADNWTKQLSRMFSKPLRPHMKSFLKSRKLNND